MTDNQGKGPPTNESRVEKITSRPIENKPIKGQQQLTQDQIKKAMGK